MNSLYASVPQNYFHFVLSLAAVIAIFSGVIFNGEKIVGSKNLLPSSSSWNSLYHLVSTFIGILLTFSPMHFLGFNVMPRRIPDFPDSFHSWNFLSSIGSGITLLSFAIFGSFASLRRQEKERESRLLSYGLMSRWESEESRLVPLETRIHHQSPGSYQEESRTFQIPKNIILNHHIQS